MPDLLYAWPDSARVEQRVPKEAIYAAGVPTPLRSTFVAEVDRVVWAYKLAPSTINIPSTDEVPEIQVFRITAKSGELSDQVLRAIDKAVQQPIIFEVTRPEAEIGSGHANTRMTAAQKVLGTGSAQLSRYFTTTWLPQTTPREALPTAISLSALYLSLLDPLLPTAHEPGENVSAAAERLATRQKLDREIAALERKLRTTKQLNRRVDVLRELKAKKMIREGQA